MASPQESVTTVNGRRCTRSRARTAAPSTLATQQPTAVTSTEITIPTTVQQTSQGQSTTDAPPRPPPPPPSPASSSSSPTTPPEQPSVALTTDIAATTIVAASSATGTNSALPTSSAPVSQLPVLGPSDQAVAAAVSSSPTGDEAVPSSVIVADAPSSLDTAASAPTQASEPTGSSPESLQAAMPTSAPPTIPTSKSSNPVIIATSLSREVSSIQRPLSIAPAASNEPTLVVTVPQLSSPSGTASPISNINLPAGKQPGQTGSAANPLPTDSTGIIAPDRGDDDAPLTLPKSGSTDVVGIAGGVAGGVAGLALIMGLLFFCLRKRKPKPVIWKEKSNSPSGFAEKLRSIPAGFGVLVAKLKGKESGPMRSTYQRHSLQNSLSSVYSTNPSGPLRFSSESQGMFAGRRTGSTRSKKSDRNLLRKKQSSISSNYQFPWTGQDQQIRSSADYADPFTDPAPPRTLLLLNPDPRSGPVTPQVPVTSADDMSRDPFASIYDLTNHGPPRVKHQNAHHIRNQSSLSAVSALSALGSHPPPSSLDNTSDPFRDPVSPLAPTQAMLPDHSRRPSSAAYPAFNAITTTSTTRDSQYTFFGEPGPSRPATSMFTPAIPTGRTVRQSDPFDLDRPEVLGFRDAVGRKDVNTGLTRQATRTKRTSSLENGIKVADGSYTSHDGIGTVTRQLWSTNGRR
ncbi:hypothetical protein J1614_010483 [Plenodomus biglobosus]|nr:hypothetical protein J1614_010483 [Plenodomus biglobosus]